MMSLEKKVQQTERNPNLYYIDTMDQFYRLDKSLFQHMSYATQLAIPCDKEILGEAQNKLWYVLTALCSERHTYKNKNGWVIPTISVWKKQGK